MRFVGREPLILMFEGAGIDIKLIKIETRRRALALSLYHQYGSILIDSFRLAGLATTTLTQPPTTPRRQGWCLRWLIRKLREMTLGLMAPV